MLEECQDSKKFRKCPRCKEPIHVNQYNEHIKDNSCFPGKSLSVANRCPLCHTDIEQGPEGWRKHLAVQGCPNNERSIGWKKEIVSLFWNDVCLEFRDK